MAFCDQDRKNIERDAADAYRGYWHTVHPVTFDIGEIYRSGWSDGQWDAMQLLMESKEDALRTTAGFKYVADFSGYANRPDWVSSSPSIYLSHKRSMPPITITECDVGESTAMALRRWIFRSCKHRQECELLSEKCQSIFQPQSHFSARGVHTSLRPPVNTPRVLHRVWPELTPFTSTRHRGEIRNSKVKKFALPRDWTEETLKIFQNQTGMEQLNHALTSAALLDSEPDLNYPMLG